MTQNNIEKKLEHIGQLLKKLQRVLKEWDQKEHEFLLYAAEKMAEEIIETAISINQILLKENLNKISDSYYQSFLDLVELKVFTETEAKKLAPTAGFRNRLAHDYLELDQKIMLKTLKSLLLLYPLYLKKISRFVEL
ncbi:hypothetical protein COT40_01420 [Candidatus Peregrinibacteria bacterium CG08_land_8_20_14_0_20_41_10]|nr:MAG: hypothetical protein COT40_01420 [Candidatus Peregrinibacteria bacterium CG08_land_8_20_14_0_20_41_10]